MFELALILSVIVLLLLGVVVLSIRSQHRINANHYKLMEDYKLMEARLNRAELETIKYKMNPHLFKNILNSIQSHAYQTYFALDKMSYVLDYILYESDKQFVSVREEMNFALSLIEINKLKLGPLFDLQVKNKIDENHPFYHQELIIPLVTVDLIENAFKHADLKADDAFISITFELKDNYFSLTVANKISPKPPIRKSKSGIGNENALKRLDIIYKEHYKLDQFKENDVFISHLKIDLLEYKDKVLIARR